MRKSCPLTAPKPSAKNAVDSRVAKVGPPQFKNRCGHKRSQGVENHCWRRCKSMGSKWPRGMQNFCRVPAETIETCTIFRRRQNFVPTNGPRFGVQKRTKRGPSRPDTKQIKLRLNEWPPFGSVSGPQNGGRFVGKILVTGRKIARGSMVSAGMRQKFSMPLLFHGFAARRHLFSTPCEHYGHTCS